MEHNNNNNNNHIRATTSPQEQPLWDWNTTNLPEGSSCILGLGKRAYSAKAKEATSSKKVKVLTCGGAGGDVVRCQVEGCGDDLSGAKEYHRKHRVCEAHSKCPRVVVAGEERRFCQQCSRFHALSEFDQKKRSCRRRLSDHNARRRKPQPDAFSFGSTRMPLSFDNGQEISFAWSKGPFSHVRTGTTVSWGGFSTLKSPEVKEIQAKSAFSTHSHDLDELSPIKGSETSLTASKLSGAPDFRRALSLLSASSWDSPNPEPATSLIQFRNDSQSCGTPPVMHSGHSASGYRMDGWPAQTPLVVPFQMHSNSNSFQEFELIKPRNDSRFLD